MIRHAVLTTVAVAALSLAVLSSACQEQIQAQIGEQPSSAELVRSAEHGDASAQFALAVMYADGRGVPQDYVEAVTWSRRAAEQSHAGAQIYLWMSYDSGLGVPQQDYVEAHMWANLAASQLTGSERERAVALRDSTAERMTTPDLSEARRRAREWNAAH